MQRVLTSLICAAVVTVTALTPAARAADGAAVFTQNCLMCHQSGAVGLAGQFPRLAGRVAIISADPKGRAYLIDVLTYGMAGNITVDEQSIIGLMPPFAQLSDDDVAGVLSYVQSLGDPPGVVTPGVATPGVATPGVVTPGVATRDKNPATFTVEEVRAGRAKAAKTAADLRAERQSLEDVHLIP